MDKLLLILLLGLGSCLDRSNNDFNAQQEIQGNWLILYPQHVLNNDTQRTIYGKVQDSIVNLLGLKLVSFTNNGEFIQGDSLFGQHGSWQIKDTGALAIRSAGKGFDNFKGTVVGLIKDTILVEELIHINEENMKLIWHLKKINSGSDGADLFDEQYNLWRKKPAQKETDDEIKARIVSMLKYYALYFKVVSKESIYFSPVRVFLPFTYYQNGVGLKYYDDDFAGCFFDGGDAQKGYNSLKAAFELSKDKDFPSGENFVAEYSEYFRRLATVIK